MMRYQRLSPDCLPLPNGRKTNLKTCKDDNQHHENGRIIPNFSTYESKPLRVRSATSSPDNHFPPFPVSTPESTITTTTTTSTSKTSLTHESNGGATQIRSDALLQWGHNKRSRGSRAENRSAGEESSSGYRRPQAKIQRRSVAGMDKQSTTAMPPPGGAGYSSRGGSVRQCTLSAGTLLNRHVEERCSGFSRSEKRPPSTAEKMHKKPLSTAHGYSTTQADSLNPSCTPSSEKEVAAGGSGTTTTTVAPSSMAAAEKLNLDLFEWPRIYISLSRKEKEDDFLVMKGTKLPQRPKKRAKNIDKTLQYCFPGLWLSDLTRGRYEVREKKCVKKKRRGLKGMESMDSESD